MLVDDLFEAGGVVKFSAGVIGFDGTRFDGGS
jgi:hypothetical protein